MQYNWFEKSSPLAKILIMLVMMVCCLFVVSFIAVLAAIPILHENIQTLFHMISDINNPANINILKYMQTVQSVALFVIPTFIVAKLFSLKPLQYLQLVKTPGNIQIIIVILIIITAIPFINYLEFINSKLQLPNALSGIEQWMKESEKNATLISENFLKVNNLRGLFFNLLMMAILPAIGEELVFRGIFQRLFSELCKNVHWGIIISAALFSAMHMQFFGFVPRMLLGVIFGYLLIWSGSIWVPIIAHFINNGIGVLYYYFNYRGNVGNKIETVGTGTNDIVVVILSLTVLMLLLFWFYRDSIKKLQDIEK